MQQRRWWLSINRESFPEADGSGFLNSAANWLAGSESAQAGGLRLSHGLFSFSWGVLVSLTWVLSAAAVSVRNYFNLTISCEVCG